MDQEEPRLQHDERDETSPACRGLRAQTHAKGVHGMALPRERALAMARPP